MRPELPSNVSMPSAAAQSRIASGAKPRSAGSSRARAGPEARQERLECLAMGDVEAALSRQQEFPAERGHGIEDMHLRHLAKAFRCGEPRRAAADDCGARHRFS